MVAVITPRVVHTAYLEAAQLAPIRRLLDVAFAGRFEDSDWDHALGGLHVLVVEADRAEADEVVAHAAVVQRQLLHDDRPIRCGYVEAVAVHPHRRGRGYAAAIMDEVERIIGAAYDIGALSASDGVEGFYLSRGWLPWQGPTCVLAPTGITRTPDEDDSTFVFPVSSKRQVRVTGMLVCDWRDGDVW
jgi:aminoglycoside 2'-N-acetyltransferase I